MRNKDLSAILQEYRPSMLLKVLDGGVETGMETPIATLLSTLLQHSGDDKLFLFGKGDCVIIRERGEDTNGPPGAVPYRSWLEIDVRH